MFGLAAIPLTVAAGIGLDYSRATEVKAKLQASVDSAVLAGAASLPDTEKAIAAAIKFFQANNIVDVQSSSFAVVNGNVQGSATSKLNTSLTKLANFSFLNIGVNSVATNGSAGMELVMVLDVSGSMGGRNSSVATGLLPI